jgi:hypothetical protein
MGVPTVVTCKPVGLWSSSFYKDGLSSNQPEPETVTSTFKKDIMQNIDASIIARFLISVATLRADSNQNADTAIRRFGRPYLSQLTANGHELAQATAMLRQAYCTH